MPVLKATMPKRLNKYNESRPCGQLPNGWRGRTVCATLPVAPMSPYELSASVTDPIVGPHVDGTVFRTLCENDKNRRSSNYYYHMCERYFKLERNLRVLANYCTSVVFKRKRALHLSDKMLFSGSNNGRLHEQRFFHSTMLMVLF